MTHIKNGDEVALKAHPHVKWVVSYVEGNKIYCYRMDEKGGVASIVADASLLMSYTSPASR